MVAKRRQPNAILGSRPAEADRMPDKTGYAFPLSPIILTKNDNPFDVWDKVLVLFCILCLVGAFIGVLALNWDKIVH